MTLRHLFAVLIMALAPVSVMAESDPTHGLWLTENGKAIVELAPCGGETCGKMVWISTPRDTAGALKLDINNSDIAARDRPLCGLRLLGGLGTIGSSKDGWIYNPRDGSTYSVAVEPISTQELKVRGYLGLPLLGSSQIWTRVPSDRGGCGA